MKINNIKIKIVISCALFFIISFISIYSISNDYAIKQMIWYLIGVLLIIILKKVHINKILDISIILYIFFNILLIFLLFFGNKINGSKCWIILPQIGSFQPSEFMKIILILINTKIFSIFENKTKHTFKHDIKIVSIIMALTILPSILTFMQPDTGMVIIYLLISFIMLYIYGIKKSIIIIFLFLLLTVLAIFLDFILLMKNYLLTHLAHHFFIV